MEKSMSLTSMINLTKQKYNIASFLVSFVVASIIKIAMTKTWEVIEFKKPPKNPGNIHFSNNHVILSSISTAIITAVAKIFAKQILTKNWERLPDVKQ